MKIWKRLHQKYKVNGEKETKERMIKKLTKKKVMDMTEMQKRTKK